MTPIAEQSTINPASVVVTQPAHGTATVNADGTIKYVSNGAEVTTDSFTYTVKDSSSAISNVASVTVTVTPVNDAPVVSGPTTPGTDGKVTGSFTVTDLNGDAVTVESGQTAKGTVEFTVTPDITTPGVYTVSYTYTPSFATRLAASYAEADTTETFTVTATDGIATSTPPSASLRRSTPPPTP